MNDVGNDVIHLRLFHFSLRDKALNYLNTYNRFLALYGNGGEIFQ